MSLKQFKVIQKLGQGTYSSVYKVRRFLDEGDYALKRVKLGNLSEKQKQNALNEVRILASIRHPNIVGYKQAFIDTPSNSLCIVMQFADHGDLYQRIMQQTKKNQHFKQADIWSVLLQMVKGLQALHQLKILHRDLKSANVFLTAEGIAKLGDMNVSKVAPQGMCNTQTGTPYYASPEVWKDMSYDLKSDIWSLGCVIYEMAALKPPFRAQDMEGLFKKVTRGFYSRIPNQYSQDLSNVLRSLLQIDPQMRPTCQKILSMPVVMRNISKSQYFQSEQLIPQLLKTINIPKNLVYLSQKLPKANYMPLKYRIASTNTKSLTNSIQKFSEAYNLNEMTSLPDIKNAKKQNKSQSIQTLLQRKASKPRQPKQKSKSNKKKHALQVQGRPYDKQRQQGGLIQKLQRREKNQKQKQYQASLVLPRLKKYIMYSNSPPKHLNRKNNSHSLKD